MAEGAGRPARRDYTGLRVARWRDIAGMTQRQLADAVGVTREYISMIENGKRAITKRSLLHDLAAALGVGVTDLTGQPVTPITPAERAMYILAPALRQALDGPDEPVQPRPAEQLAKLADLAMSARMAGDWATLGLILPDLFAETQVLAEVGEALATTVKACIASSFAVRLLGFIDLGRLLADRAARYADRLGDPEYVAAAEFGRAAVVLEAGSRHRSLQISEQAVTRLQPANGIDTVRGWSMLLHLHSALSAASLGRTDDTSVHLAEAADLAPHVDTDPWHMEVKPANVGVWRVGVALENGEPERAPELARRVDRSALRTADRQARLHFDAGRGWFARGDYDRCVRSLLEADRIYPLLLWTRPQALEIVGQMARESRVRGGSSELLTLCARVGIDPLAPPEVGNGW
jgi:transcriptional regulator with XRE-family HTH domain